MVEVVLHTCQVIFPLIACAGDGFAVCKWSTRVASSERLPEAPLALRPSDVHFTSSMLEMQFFYCPQTQLLPGLAGLRVTRKAEFDNQCALCAPSLH